MSGTKVAYSAEGIEFIGTVFAPAGSGPAPGVLVAHESPGVTAHNLDAARRLARMGFVAMATDYQGGGQVVTDRAGMGAALEALKAQPRVDASRLAAVGYCYGGAAAIELARSGADLKAAVGYHSTLTTVRPQDATQIRCPVLVHIGSDDPAVPVEQRTAFQAEMTATGVDWRLMLYGRTGHSFTNPEADGWGMPGFAYSAAADRRSWAATQDLFAEVGLL
jgi:dienelactone hydrolase